MKKELSNQKLNIQRKEENSNKNFKKKNNYWKRLKLKNYKLYNRGVASKYCSELERRKVIL